MHGFPRPPTLNRIILRELQLAEAQGLVTIAGDGAKLAELFALLDDFSMGFPNRRAAWRAWQAIDLST